MKCPHEQFIDDDCSGQQFTTDAYRYWTEGHASRDGEVADLKKALDRIAQLGANPLTQQIVGTEEATHRQKLLRVIDRIWHISLAALEVKHA